MNGYIEIVKRFLGKHSKHDFPFILQYKKSQTDLFFVCPSIDRCLEHLKGDDNSDLAIGGSRQHILNSRFYSPEKMFCFDRNEIIASYQPRLLMRKDFPFKSRVNEIIRNAFEGGLFVKWSRESKRQRERVIQHERFLAISLQVSFGPFLFFCGCGSILATLALLSEYIIFKKMSQKNRSRIWVYLEQFFDGKRHYLTNLPEKLMKLETKPKKSHSKMNETQCTTSVGRHQ